MAMDLFLTAIFSRLYPSTRCDDDDDDITNRLNCRQRETHEDREREQYAGIKFHT